MRHRYDGLIIDDAVNTDKVFIGDLSNETKEKYVQDYGAIVYSIAYLLWGEQTEEFLRIYEEFIRHNNISV